MFPIRRNALLMLVVLCLGCDQKSIQTVETVVASNGTDRLIRRDWETISSSDPNRKSYDSHSLVWQRLRSGFWVDHRTITQADFQHGHNHRRWVSEIHAFDPASGTAILKIAEDNALENSPVIACIYSWREWDINNNRELKTIRVCDNPFEKFVKAVPATDLEDTTEQSDAHEPE